MHVLRSVAVVVATPLGGCSDASKVSKFTTPEEAILGIEDAYRAKDLDAVVACKDFKLEAKFMLEGLGKFKKEEIDEELIGKTAEVLELAFRTEIKEKGFPDMKGVRSTFPSKKDAGANCVVVTELCHYPDGGTSSQKILVAKTDNGWRVLDPVE